MNPTDFITWALRGLRNAAQHRPNLFAQRRDLYIHTAQGHFGYQSPIVDEIDGQLPTSPAESLGNVSDVETFPLPI